MFEGVGGGGGGERWGGYPMHKASSPMCSFIFHTLSPLLHSCKLIMLVEYSSARKRDFGLHQTKQYKTAVSNVNNTDHKVGSQFRQKGKFVCVIVAISVRHHHYCASLANGYTFNTYKYYTLPIMAQMELSILGSMFTCCLLLQFNKNSKQLNAL